MKIIKLFTTQWIITLVLFGCTNGEAVEMEKEFPPTTSGKIEVEGTEYDMLTGNYSWERKKGLVTENVTTDAASPYHLADKFGAIQVWPNTEIKLKIEGNPRSFIYLWGEDGREKEVDGSNNRITVPASAGQYIYEVLGQWANGEVSYTFVVDVK